MTVAIDNATRIRDGYELFAKQDIEGVLALFSPQIRWTIPGPAPVAGEYVGHEGVGEFFKRIATVWSRLEVRPTEFIAEGDTVVAVGRHVGEGPGGTFDVGFAHVWQLEDGRSVSFHEYTDTAALERALG